MKNRWESENKRYADIWNRAVDEFNAPNVSTIKEFCIISGIFLTAIELYFVIMYGLMTGYIENKINSRSYKESNVFDRIDGIVLNVLGIGTNAGRLFEHIDTEFYRNRIRRVY